MTKFFEPVAKPKRRVQKPASASFAVSPTSQIKFMLVDLSNQEVHVRQFYVLDCLKPQTRLLIGALVQILLYATLPAQWAAVPALAMLFTSVISTVIQVMSPSVNPFKEGVVPGRATAQIPSPNGTCGPTPSNTSVVVFNIGIQINHPLGLLAPHVKTIATFFNTMIADITSRRDELGLLSVSEWRGNDGAAGSSNNTLKVTLYFRDPAKVNAYAQERLHREAWRFFEKVGGEGHVGVYHEMFCVPARGWETVYVNCRPVLLGAAVDEKVATQTTLGKNDSTARRFVRPVLVGCDTPVLNTQYARMGRTEDGLLKDEVADADQS